jgi:NAD(P)-dependent dehydrogenase (short-subunit alcohol dehydrogenase family)
VTAGVDATGRAAVVTGGTDGIGKEIARGLASRGTRVIIVGRDPAKGLRAAREIADSTGNPDIDFVAADLSLMREAGRLAMAVAARFPALHYLVHCAGIVAGRREVTAEGIESNFAVNYLSRFALTLPLLPLLEAGGRPGRAARIMIAGGAAQRGTIYFDDVNLTSNFSTLRAVAQFCRANDIFTIELARRLAIDSKVPRVTVSCLKIGVVKTNIRRTFPRWMKILVPLVIDPMLAQTPSEVAAAALDLLLHESLEGVTGALFLKIRKLRFLTPSRNVLDAAAAERLWKLSENLCGM